MNPQMAIAITGKNAAKPAFDSVISDANRAAASMAAAGDRASFAMGGAGFATSNLAAQFNDIGVMLASGQSPLLLAIQQGTQISQVLGPMKAGAAVQALKGALVSLISPVSLITIGSIAAGAALVQWMMSARSDAETATEAFDRHRKEIEGIVAGYGAAETAVGAYFDALAKRPQSIATSELNTAFETISAEVEAFRAQMAGFANDPLFAKFGSDAILSMQSLAKAFAEGEITAEEFYHELDDVKTKLNLLEVAGAAIPGSTQNMITAWQEGALKAIQFGDALSNLIAQSHALAGIAQDADLTEFFDANSVEGALSALERLTPELRTQQQIIEDTYSAALANPVLTNDARERLALARDEALAAMATADARREASRHSGQSSRDAERERQAVKDLIEELEHEQSLIGLTNQQKEIQNALRQAGAAATDDERRKIAQLIAAMDAEQEALDQLEKTWSAVSSIGLGAARGLVDALRDGKIEASELNSIFERMIDNVFNMGFDLLGGIFSGPGNPLAGLFSGLGGQWNIPSSYVPGGFYPGLAGGGTVMESGLTWVGEDGPELLNLPRGATVTPSRESMAAVSRTSSAGARRVEVHIHQDRNHKGEPEASVSSQGDVDMLRVVMGLWGEGMAQGRGDTAMSSLFGLRRKGH